MQSSGVPATRLLIYSLNDISGGFDIIAFFRADLLFLAINTSKLLDLTISSESRGGTGRDGMNVAQEAKLMTTIQGETDHRLGGLNLSLNDLTPRWLAERANKGGRDGQR